MASYTSRKGRLINLDDYAKLSRMPLQSLIFLIPMLSLYEWGAWQYAGKAPNLMARRVIYDSFEWFGAGGYFIPVLALIAILISIHIANKDKFQIRFGVYFGMGFESLAFAMPLLIIATVWVGRPFVQEGQWLYEMYISLGAGIYEELIFRLIAIAIIHMIIVDLMGASHRSGAIIAIFGSAAIFSWYHFDGYNAFTPGKAAFYMLSGLYLAFIYEIRGFGIAAGTHAFYDVLTVAIARGLWPAE